MACCPKKCVCNCPPGPPGPTFSSITVTTDYVATPQFRVIFEAGVLPPAGPGQRTLYLPAVPVLDEEYIVKDVTGTASAGFPIVVDGNGKLIDATATKTIATAFGAMHLKYDGTQWRVI